MSQFAESTEISAAVAGGGVILDIRGVEEASRLGNCVDGSVKTHVFTPADQGASFVSSVISAFEDKSVPIVLH